MIKMSDLVTAHRFLLVLVNIYSSRGKIFFYFKYNRSKTELPGVNSKYELGIIFKARVFP